MTARQAALFGKADRALEGAVANLAREDAEVAVNRAYYACFYAATAALLEADESPKSHAGTHRRFAYLLIAPGHVPQDVGRTLEDAFRMRQRSDYDAFAVTDLGAAADLLADAERFVAAVRAAVARGGHTAPG